MNKTKIDLLLAEKHMTRKDLSVLAGVPYRTIESWCTRTRATRDVYQLRKVARALDVPIEDVIEEPHPK